jgi:hypothetical protein
MFEFKVRWKCELLKLRNKSSAARQAWFRPLGHAVPRLAVFTIGMILFLVTSSALGQGLGTIVGTVNDSTGSVVSNADIKAVNESTGLSRKVLSNFETPCKCHHSFEFTESNLRDRY